MLAFVTLFHCAICYTSSLQLVLPIQYSLILASVMPEGDQDDADVSRSFVKDLDNIRRQDFLLHVDLEDPDVAREHWIGSLYSFFGFQSIARGVFCSGMLQIEYLPLKITC